MFTAKKQQAIKRKMQRAKERKCLQMITKRGTLINFLSIT